MSLAILACISNASRVAEIPEKGLFVLENNLNSSDAYVRNLSFRGLMWAKEKGYFKSKILK